MTQGVAEVLAIRCLSDRLHTDLYPLRTSGETRTHARLVHHDDARLLQVINPAPLNSTNSAANTIYSGPAYWPANGGQIFYRGRRTSPTGATLFRRALPLPSIMLSASKQAPQPFVTATQAPDCKSVEATK